MTTSGGRRLRDHRARWQPTHPTVACAIQDRNVTQTSGCTTVLGPQNPYGAADTDLRHKAGIAGRRREQRETVPSSSAVNVRRSRQGVADFPDVMTMAAQVIAPVCYRVHSREHIALRGALDG